MLWEDLEEKMMDMKEMEAEDVDVEEGKELRQVGESNPMLTARKSGTIVLSHGVLTKHEGKIHGKIRQRSFH